MANISMRRTRLWTLSLTCLVILIGCETSQLIEVGVLWNDDSHFSNSNATFLAIAEGEFDQETGFDTILIELTSVSPGENEVHKYSFSTTSSNNYTAFIFVDENHNGTYDEGYDIISGYKYNCAAAGECLSISVSSFY